MTFEVHCKWMKFDANNPTRAGHGYACYLKNLAEFLSKILLTSFDISPT